MQNVAKKATFESESFMNNCRLQEHRTQKPYISLLDSVYALAEITYCISKEALSSIIQNSMTFSTFHVNNY